MNLSDVLALVERVRESELRCESLRGSLAESQANLEDAEAKLADLNELSGNPGQLKLAACRALLAEAHDYVYAQNQAEHMLDGFGGRRPRPSDGLLDRMEDAIAGEERP